MIMELLSQNCPSRVTLIMGSPYSSDLLYHQQFEALAAQHPNFTYLTAISRERGSGGGGGKSMYAHDRLLAERERLAAQLVSERCLIYVCGIAGMELGIFQSLAAMLTPEQLAQYLTVKPEAGEPKAWDRKMISKTLVPTKRVMLEVY